jgi:serine/threonine-protein kinase RsbW
MNPTARAQRRVFRLTLASIPRNVGKIEKFLDKVRQHIMLDEIQHHKLMISITEAVNNAIVHGNKSNPARKVTVRCEAIAGGLVTVVKDAGRGFRPEKVDNPLKAENILKESGRGIFLMRTLMDRVEFRRTPAGMEVELWLEL